MFRDRARSSNRVHRRRPRAEGAPEAASWFDPVLSHADSVVPTSEPAATDQADDPVAASTLGSPESVDATPAEQVDVFEPAADAGQVPDDPSELVREHVGAIIDATRVAGLGILRGVAAQATAVQEQVAAAMRERDALARESGRLAEQVAALTERRSELLDELEGLGAAPISGAVVDLHVPRGAEPGPDDVWFQLAA